MGSKQSLVFLCCIALFLGAAPRLPYWGGGEETLFSLLWLTGIVLHMAANMYHMKMMFLGKRRKEMQQRFWTMRQKEVNNCRHQQWQRVHSVTH